MADPFIDFVRLAGFLVAAATALGLMWRRKTKWEPQILSLADAPVKVAGLITTLFLGALWFDNGVSFGLPSLQTITIGGGVITVVALLGYVFLNTVHMYSLDRAASGKRVTTIKIIGGLWLDPRARQARASGNDIQTILKKSGNNPDLVWPRSARALSETLFILAYVLLVCGGTIALSAVALLIYRGTAGQ